MSVVVVAPLIVAELVSGNDQVAPPSVLISHPTVGAGEPMAVEVNVVGSPASADALNGGTTTTGAEGATTVRVAGCEVTDALGVALVKTQVIWSPFSVKDCGSN